MADAENVVFHVSMHFWMHRVKPKRTGGPLLKWQNTWALMASIVEGSATIAFASRPYSKAGVFIAMPERWSRCGWVMRKPWRISRNKYSALAFALICGKRRPNW